MPNPLDALDYARRFTGNLPLDDLEIRNQILDDASKKLWMAHPWPWSVAALEAVTITDDAQEKNLVSAYADLLCLQNVAITDGQGKRDLAISSVIPVTTVMKGPVSQVMFVPGTPAKLRFFPVPKGYSGTNTVLSIYKKKATAITDDTVGTEYSTTTGVHDEWFWVYREIVLAKAFAFTHDPRLGAAQFAPNGVQYTGQLAVVEAAIAEMWKAEEKFFTTVGAEVANG